jgi:hypothetical protein
MAENISGDDTTVSDADTTGFDRRTAIKGAVAAGVGAVAFAGPSIDGFGLVPAYGSVGTPGGISGSAGVATAACSWPLNDITVIVGDGSYGISTFGNVGENGGPDWSSTIIELPTNCTSCQVTNISMAGCNGGCDNTFNAQSLCGFDGSNTNHATPSGFPGNSGNLSCECEPCTAASCGGSSEVTATFTVTCT